MAQEARLLEGGGGGGKGGEKRDYQALFEPLVFSLKNPYLWEVQQILLQHPEVEVQWLCSKILQCLQAWEAWW